MWCGLQPWCWKKPGSCCNRSKAWSTHPVSNLWSPFSCLLTVFDPYMELRPLTQRMTSSDFSPDKYLMVWCNVTRIVLYNCLFSRIRRTSETPAHFSCADKQFPSGLLTGFLLLEHAGYFSAEKMSVSYLAGTYISLSLERVEDVISCLVLWPFPPSKSLFFIRLSLFLQISFWVSHGRHLPHQVKSLCVCMHACPRTLCC